MENKIAMRDLLHRALTTLASLWLTLALLVIFAVGVFIVDLGWATPTLALALPFVLLAINLCAAIFCIPLFRRQLPLLLFHLALLAVLLLAAAGRLSYLKGVVSLTENSAFTGQLDRQQQGPWHIGDLAQVYFSNDGFIAEYIPRNDGSERLFRRSTENRVSWFDEAGNKQQAVIGDDHPLILEGYRIYTVPRKGFALQFVWYPNDRSLPRWGEVHLQSYPAFKYEQAQQWTIPDTNESIWCQLQFDENILDPQQKSNFRMPEQHQVVIRMGPQGTQRHILKTGDSIELSGGRLRYQGLTTWIGYRFVYDWTLAWIAAASFTAVMSLCWFYWRRFSNQSWLKNKDKALVDGY